MFDFEAAPSKNFRPNPQRSGSLVVTINASISASPRCIGGSTLLEVFAIVESIHLQELRRIYHGRWCRID
jgi:hypothetical protein